MLCEIEHLALDLHFRNIAESVLGGTDFVVKIQGCCDQALIFSPNEECSCATENHCLSKSDNFLGFHSFPDQSKSLFPVFIAWREIVWLVKIDVVEIVNSDKCLNRKGLVAFRYGGR